MLVKEMKYVLSKPFETQNNHVIENGVVAYEEYGNPNGEVIVICHGGLSSHHAAGKYNENDALEGWWSGLIGDGKVFDTNKYRIICANALGGLFGTTAPSNYGKPFPEITMIDQANYLKQFLDDVGVRKIHVMSGVSMGSLLTLQMAVLYPELVENIIPVATSAYMTPGGLLGHNFMINVLEMCKEDENNTGLNLFNQFGKLYFTSFHLCNSICANILEQNEREKAIQKYLTDGVELKSKTQNAANIITTLKAINTFSIANGFGSLEEAAKRIKANCLVINVDNDIEFPPMFGEKILDLLKDNGTHNEFRVISSQYGHLGCVLEQPQLEKHIKEFISNK